MKTLIKNGRVFTAVDDAAIADLASELKMKRDVRW